MTPVAALDAEAPQRAREAGDLVAQLAVACTCAPCP